jgi:hypothetical protein
MPDYREGVKKEVAEIKFLIHDLRVERFINEVIHFHATLDTDLEIYSVDQAQVLHGEDLQVLKKQAVGLRRALQDYTSAVKSFSPERTILLTGRKYIDTIYSICELILDPLWGRADKVLNFLPPDSRSVGARLHYRNCVNWIRGVHRRIRHFQGEQAGSGWTRSSISRPRSRSSPARSSTATRWRRAPRGSTSSSASSIRRCCAETFRASTACTST